MRPRTILAVAVVAALMIGGATTGTTLALWRDQGVMTSSELDSGDLVLRLNGSATATLGSLTHLEANSGPTPGAHQSVSATLTHASATGGRNLRMRLHLDTVTSGNADLVAGLEVAASTVATTATCPASPGSPSYKPLSNYTTTSLGPEKLAPGTSRKLCVSVRVKGGAAAGAQGQTGTLTFTFRGEQVRP